MINNTKKSSFSQLKAASLFCPHCNQAQPVVSKLLLCLPEGDKYAYYCQRCNAELASKLEKTVS